MLQDPRADEIKFVDLCAGLGGFHVALSVVSDFLREQSGQNLTFTCVAASELQADLRECYVKNFPDLNRVYGDLHPVQQTDILRTELGEHKTSLGKAFPQYDRTGNLLAIHGDMACFLTDDEKALRRYPNGSTVLPPHDLLCAGFPCQPFSKSGAQRGFDDTRGTVFHMIATMLRFHRPAFVLLENVGNFEKHDGGNTWRRVREILDVELGYDVVASEHLAKNSGGVGLLSPHYIGFPHHRERFFIVAQRRETALSDPTVVRELLSKTLTADCFPSRQKAMHWVVSADDRARNELKKIVAANKELSELGDLKQAQVSPERVACISHWQRLLDKLASIDDEAGTKKWRDSMPSFPIWGYELDPWNWYDCTSNPATTNTSPAQRRAARTANLERSRAQVLETSNGSVDISAHPPAGHRAWLSTLDGETVDKWVSTWPAYASKRTEWPSWKRRFIEQNRAWALQVWASTGSAWMREWLDELYLRIPAPSNQKLEWNCKGEELSLWKQILQFRPSGLRVKRLVHVPALVAMTTTQIPIVPRINLLEPSPGAAPGAMGRHLMRSEALQLQGFPPNWAIPAARERAFACFGNAVHAGVVASVVANWLSRQSDTKSSNTPEGAIRGSHASRSSAVAASAA